MSIDAEITGKESTDVADRPAISRKKRCVFVLLVAALCLLFVECSARGILYYSPNVLDGAALPLSTRHENIKEAITAVLQDRQNSNAQFDADLGWRTRKGVNNGFDIVNAAGLRSTREYSREALAGVLRIAVFGDSFVYGSEVRNHECWTSLLEQQCSRLEVLNYGVAGFGPDQAYLRFLAEANDLSPKRVFFGVATPSLPRILSVSAAFRSTSPHFISKPRFILDDEGELLLRPSPIRQLSDLNRILEDPTAICELGEFDYFYEPILWEYPALDHFAFVRLGLAGWSTVSRRFFDPQRPLIGGRNAGVMNESSNAFRVLTRILDRFVKTARERGMEPTILVLPDGFSLDQKARRITDILEPVTRYCEEKKLPFVDLTEAFVAAAKDHPPDALFIDRYHYAPLGNAIVASWLLEKLELCEE